MKNLATGDEYLKELNGGGNLFRLYLDPNKLPSRVTHHILDGQLMNDADTLAGR